jgi:hypothetical protein
LGSGPSFGGVVGGGNDYVTSLAIPTTVNSYQSFPNLLFQAEMFFADGDWENGVDPYQYVDTSVAYSITSISVSAIPAPATASMLGLAALAAARRRRR